MSGADRQPSRSALIWLVAGAALGVAVAAGSLVSGGTSKPPAIPSGGDASDAVAIVNGEPITREALARFADAIARGRGRLELDPDERRRVLARLIDEELLFQRGLALGLDRREPAARRAIVTAMIDALTTEMSEEPSQADLEQFLREQPKDFTRPGRVVVEAARIPLEQPPSARVPARAAEAVRRARAGESLGVIGAELGSPIEPPLQVGPVTIDALRDRVGGIVVQALANLVPGDTSEPIRAMDGWWVVHLIAREPDAVPSLEEVYEPVRQAWMQREHEQKLAGAIAALRAEADVEIMDPELAGE